MARINRAPRVRQMGTVASLNAPGLAVVNPKTTPPDFSTAKQLGQMLDIMSGLGKVYSQKLESEKDEIVYERGLGATAATHAIGPYERMFKAGPTVENVRMFPRLRLGDEEGLDEWSQSTALSGTADMTESQRKGYMTQMVPALKTLAGDWTLKRAKASELGRVRGAQAALGLETHDVAETVGGIVSALQFSYEPEAFADTVLLPAIDIALESKNYSRAQELMEFTSASVADPVKREDLKTRMTAGLLPGMRAPLVQAISGLQQTGDATDVLVFQKFYEQAGGINNKEAIDAVVGAVREYTGGASGMVIEEHVGMIGAMQSIMSKPGDPLHTKLSGLEQEARANLLYQENTMVSRRTSKRNEMKYQATNTSLEMINAGDITPEKEEAHFEKLREQFGLSAEQYIEDYFTMKNRRRTATRESDEDNMSEVHTLNGMIAQSWNEHTARNTRGQIANALTAGFITQPTYWKMMGQVEDKGVLAVADANKDLGRLINNLTTQFYTSAGLRYEKFGEGMFASFNFDLEDLSNEEISTRIEAVEMLKLDFRQAWHEWHLSDEGRALMVIPGQLEYTKAASVKLTELFKDFSKDAREAGSNLNKEKNKNNLMTNSTKVN